MYILLPLSWLQFRSKLSLLYSRNLPCNGHPENLCHLSDSVVCSLDGKKKIGGRKKRWKKNDVECLQTGQEIHEACEQAYDPADVQVSIVCLRVFTGFNVNLWSDLQMWVCDIEPRLAVRLLWFGADGLYGICIFYITSRHLDIGENVWSILLKFGRYISIKSCCRIKIQKRIWT